MVRFAERQDAAIQLFDLSLIEHVDSPIQGVSLYQHPQYGRVLVIGGELHHVEAWQELYHEPLVHLPASFIPKIEAVLVLGGGCLYAAREALKYNTVKVLDIVEHDPAVLDLVARHYEHAAAILNDRRTQIHLGDARAVHRRILRLYDLIISDCIDLSAENDGTVSLYQKLEGMLSPDGVCSEVMYRSIFESRTVQQVQHALRQCSHVRYGLITIPEYPGILHVHTLWGRNPRLRGRSGKIANRVQARHMKDGSLRLRFFDPAHRAFFLYMPPYALERMAAT